MTRAVLWMLATKVGPSPAGSATVLLLLPSSQATNRFLTQFGKPVSEYSNRSTRIQCADVFDPFFPMRSLSQVINMMDQFIDDPFFNRNWDVKEDNDVLRLRIDMPGLGKEGVKVVVEWDTLVIRGEEQKEMGEGEDSAGGVRRRRYLGRIELPANRYKVDEIKAEMKHGVVKVVVLKVKDEERQDVVEVAVDE